MQTDFFCNTPLDSKLWTRKGDLERSKQIKNKTHAAHVKGHVICLTCSDSECL